MRRGGRAKVKNERETIGRSPVSHFKRAAFQDAPRSTNAWALPLSDGWSGQDRGKSRTGRAWNWCGGRGSNPRPTPCKGAALPLSYRRARPSRESSPGAANKSRVSSRTASARPIAFRRIKAANLIDATRSEALKVGVERWGWRPSAPSCDCIERESRSSSAPRDAGEGARSAPDAEQPGFPRMGQRG